MLICSICGIDFWPTGRWHDDWCDGCHTGNFAQSQEWGLHDPTARDALDTYVDSSRQLTPRQHQALRRVAERWAQEED